MAAPHDPHDFAARLARLSAGTRTDSIPTSESSLRQRLDKLTNPAKVSSQAQLDERWQKLQPTLPATREDPEREGKMQDRLSRILGNDSSAGQTLLVNTLSEPQARQVSDEDLDPAELDAILRAAVDDGDRNNIEDATILDKKLSQLVLRLNEGKQKAVRPPIHMAEDVVAAFLASGLAKGETQPGDDDDVERLMAMAAEEVHLSSDSSNASPWDIPRAPSHMPRNTPGEGQVKARIGAGPPSGLCQPGKSQSRTAPPQAPAPARQNSEDGNDAWCCICCQDAELQCSQCQAEMGREDGLFCRRCFRESHGKDQRNHKATRIEHTA